MFSRVEATSIPMAADQVALTAPSRLTSMFDQYFQFVWRSVRRLGVPDQAVDDATQEVFVVASRRLGAIELGKEKAFLFGTACGWWPDSGAPADGDPVSWWSAIRFPTPPAPTRPSMSCSIRSGRA